MSNVVTVHVADPFGNLRAQVHPALSSISWLLNGVGAVGLTMPVNDDKWVEDNFRAGGMVLLEFDNGLPAWVGLSTGNQRIRWNGKTATVNYQSAEQYLSRRMSGKNVTFENATVADVVSTLLNEMNGKRKSILQAGELWTSSPTIRREYHYQNLFSLIKQLGQDTGGDWGITGGRGTGLNRAKIALFMNFWKRRGVVKPDVAFVEDRNATVVSYTEQDGGMINDMVVVGSGANWLSTRPEGLAVDRTSIETYDLWEGVAVENNISNVETLTAMAEARKDASLRPYAVLTLDVVNLAPATFASYDVGDTVQVLAPSVGWNGLDSPGRVTARTFDPETGICRVLVEVTA